MGVKEIPFHPLCCISTLHTTPSEPLPLLQDHPSLFLPRARSLPCFGSSAVAGLLYKWTNYGKGWQWRWFCLKDGVLYYSKIHRSHCVYSLLIGDADDVTVIGGRDPRVPAIPDARIEEDGLQFKNKGRVAIVQLKVKKKK